MKTIICPVDFSKTSIHAAEFASFLASDFGAEITLLNVYEAPVIYSDIPLEPIRNEEENIVTELEGKLNRLKETLAKKFKQVKFKTTLIEGNVAEAVSDFSKSTEADMIVVGKTGNSKLKRLLMGSTTAEIIREAECPVLVVPPEKKYSAFKKIVFATDLHEDNINSSISIAEFAKHFDSEIIFVYVDDKHFIHSDEKVAEMTMKIKKRIKFPKLFGYIAKNTSVSKGLEYFLEKHKVDLVVMFSHQRHFPGNLFHQSLTTIASYQVKIPLLALKISGKNILE